ncbi:type II toxin-antitoxin system death-on-curing family toxin [Halomonas sp. C05BenzN]|uniref:type II toxin-antitoxin system death-on-curing family toxin n=1 Tax=Halomonas sp. C05BenzN TaxID=3411041 RepID=UPI003B92D8BB
MAEITRLSEGDVLAIRNRMSSLKIASRDAFGQVDPLHPDKLASAVFRQHTGGGGQYKYNTVHDVGATLFFGIALSHAFENGNKRTALVSLLVFLDRNNTLLVDASEEDLYDLARSVAAHEIKIQKGKNRNADSEVSAIASWIRDRARSRVMGDTAMEFKGLKSLLEDQGCTFGSPDKNFIKIRRGQWVVKTGYPRANFEVPVGEMKKIRKQLRLDEVHGIDSAGFYDMDETVDAFVNKYRNLMKWLADL